MSKNDCNSWPFNIRGHGAGGYDWLLLGRGFSLKIGHWKEPMSRPSLMAEIHSETLWSKGPKNSVDRILGLLDNAGASINKVKVSRVDLFDVKIKQGLWSIELVEYAVKRATDVSLHYHHGELTGITVGRGIISARLYDKVLEIKQKSQKFWMFEIWGIKEVAQGKKMIRVEFQLRREVIKGMGLDTFDDFLQKIEDVWTYCTQEWLKFQDRPGKHHTQRSTMEWWKVIQKAFGGVQNGHPVIRSKAFQTNVTQLARQAWGQITSLQAVALEELGAEMNTNVDAETMLKNLQTALILDGKNERDLNKKVALKRAKYHRAKDTITDQSI